MSIHEEVLPQQGEREWMVIDILAVDGYDMIDLYIYIYDDEYCDEWCII